MLILSPHYSEEHYPMFWDYNLGGMLSDVTINRARTGFESFKIVRASRNWIFADFDRIFDDAVRHFDLSAETYDMFGHSAGGQILQRYALFSPGSKADRLVAANAGWYTVPDFNTAFPYGLKNAPASRARIRSSFKADLIIFLGELDNADETRGHLARNRHVDVQGLHRFARGNHFFQVSEKAARELGADFNWRLEHVPGIGHDYRGMSRAAARFLYNR